MKVNQILLVEDLPHVMDWVKAATEMTFPDANILTAETYQKAVAVIAESGFDLVLLDIGLPDGSGLDLMAQIIRQNPEVLIVISTLFDDDAHVFKALRLGAKGYILKDQSKSNLTQMLADINIGHLPISPGVANKLLHFFAPPAQTNELTPRESEVLTCVAKGYSVPQAAELLAIKNNTCYGYIKSIYRKLDINSRAEAALEAAKMGLVDPRTD